MSYWTHIRGIITVVPPGDTKEERDAMLDNVLSHLPRVDGSEGGITVHAIPKSYDTLKVYGGKGRLKNYDIPNEYIVTVEGNLRDTHFDSTLRNFTKWMCRLSKRVDVLHTLVEISDHRRTYIIDNNNCAYSNMYVEPSYNKGEKYE